MRLILLLGLLISSLSTVAAVPLEKQQFVLKKPTPKWFGERIALPPKGFAPDLEIPNQIFETDWSFYDYLFEAFSYFPQFFPDESDSSEDD